MSDGDSAHALAEQMLDETERAIFAGDFEAFAACFTIPLISESFAGQQVIKTREMFEAFFRDICRFYLVNNVTELVRHVISAEFKSESTFHMVHQSRYLTKQGRTLDLHATCFTRYQHIDGAWRGDLMRYANSGSPEVDTILAGVNLPHAQTTTHRQT